jgi:hypothetical protein
MRGTAWPATRTRMYIVHYTLHFLHGQSLLPDSRLQLSPSRHCFSLTAKLLSSSRPPQRNMSTPNRLKPRRTQLQRYISISSLCINQAVSIAPTNPRFVPLAERSVQLIAQRSKICRTRAFNEFYSQVLIYLGCPSRWLHTSFVLDPSLFLDGIDCLGPVSS